MNAWVADFVGGSNDFIDVVSDFVNFAIVWIDGFEATLHFVGKEAIEWLPERFAEEEHWHFWHFAFLHEDENFGEFIHSAKTAREEDINFGCHGKHDFARKEVVELDGVGNVRVDVLLVSKLDVEANRTAAGFVGAFVGSLHDAWATTGNYSMAVLGEFIAEFFGFFAPFAFFGKAGGAKN